jgi:hypothetical protein
MAKAKAAMGWAFMMTFVPLGYIGTFRGSDLDVRGRKKYQLKKLIIDNQNLLDFIIFYQMKLQELTGLTGSKLQAKFKWF